MGIFKIEGKAEKTVPYDMVRVDITFKKQSSKPAVASKGARKDCEAFLSKMSDGGIDPSDFTLENDSVRQGYGDKRDYIAEREIAIKLSYDSKLINYIESVIEEADYEAGYHLSYFFSNASEFHEQLLQEALLDSKKKAEILAEKIGCRVIGVESLSKDKDTNVENYVFNERRMDCLRLDIPNLHNSVLLSPKESKEEEQLNVAWKIE